jgi:GH24 family phage-related lysozyme (muramidase)
MKDRKTFVDEARDDDTSLDTRRGIINFITSNFYRFINQPDAGDNKSLLMLIAALSVLNTSNEDQATQAARRLAQMALVRSGKKRG